MGSFDRITPAERRLAMLLLCLSLLGYATRGLRRLSPEVESWLGEGAGPGDAPPDTVSMAAGRPESRESGASPGRPDGSPGPARAAGQRDAAGPGGAPGSGGSPVLLDPNRADRALLMTLPGVGPVLAGRIVEDRERHGPFRTAEDLLRVSGIGPTTLARLKPFLRFATPPSGSSQPGG